MDKTRAESETLSAKCRPTVQSSFILLIRSAHVGATTAAALLGALSFAASAAHAQIVNGDFETGTLTPFSSSNSVNIFSKSDYGIAGNFPQGGNYFATFGASNGSGGILTQTIATTIGVNYTVSFLYGAYTNTGNNAPESISAQAFSVVGGTPTTLLGSTAVTDSSATSDPAALFSGPFTYTFTATTTQTAIRFTDTTPAASAPSTDGFLDNVSVTVSAPEPSVLSLALAGLLTTVFVRRRRQCR